MNEGEKRKVRGKKSSWDVMFMIWVISFNNVRIVYL